jgi:hypothetical protein
MHDEVVAIVGVFVEKDNRDIISGLLTWQIKAWTTKCPIEKEMSLTSPSILSAIYPLKGQFLLI